LHTVGLLNGMTADFCRLDMAPWLRGEPDLQPSARHQPRRFRRVTNKPLIVQELRDSALELCDHEAQHLGAQRSQDVALEPRVAKQPGARRRKS
jgi:hypothetical protein